MCIPSPPTPELRTHMRSCPRIHPSWGSPQAPLCSTAHPARPLSPSLVALASRVSLRSIPCSPFSTQPSGISGPQPTLHPDWILKCRRICASSRLLASTHSPNSARHARPSRWPAVCLACLAASRVLMPRPPHGPPRLPSTLLPTHLPEPFASPWVAPVPRPGRPPHCN